MTDALRQFMEAQGYAQHVIDRGILDYLVPSWEATVDEIEKGYGDIIEEYTNDVSAREIIHECQSLWPEAEREEIRGRLSEADRRFIAATVPVEEPVWRKAQGEREEQFWYFRAPESCLVEFQLKKRIE